MAPFLATESLLTTYTRFHHAVLDLEMRIKFEFNVEGKLLHVNLREMPGKDKWNVPHSKLYFLSLQPGRDFSW